MSVSVDSKTSKLKQTPYTEFHVAAGAKMVPFAGYFMPVQFTGIIEEHHAVRNGVGLFDLTHMGEFIVSGPKALEFLQKVTTNDVAVLEKNQVQYTCMTYPDGGIIDDFLIYNLNDYYMLVVNAANAEKDLSWFRENLIEGANLIDRSDQISLLAIQGPDSQKLLSELTDFNLDDLKYYFATEANIAGRKVLFSRTGYTGEEGYELYIPNNDGSYLWKAIYEAGLKYKLAMIGLGARDSLRLEMKMALYGNDIDQTTNPYEAGLGWIVKLDKGNFIGRQSLAAIKAEKPQKKLVCLTFKDKLFPRKGYAIYDGEEKVGQITSGTVSPSLGIPIALGYLPRRLSRAGNKVEVEVRGRRFIGEVVKPPFYKKESTSP